MMIYDVAKELGNRVLKTIEPLIIRGEIAGSIRRKKSEVHDVDIVVIPKPVDIVRLTPTQTLLNTFGTHMIENKLTEKLGAKVIKHGPKLLVVTIGGNQVDIYAATEDDWGIQLLRWTGSMEH
jgi:DNA polymerase/3'-5' exonuclease PolX